MDRLSARKTGRGELLPNVEDVVADPLEILRDHQQVERILAVVGVRRDLADERALDLLKVIVDGIVVGVVSFITTLRTASARSLS